MLRKIIEKPHPFIIKTHNIYQTEQSIWYVMDFVAGGDLQFHLTRTVHDRFPELQARFYFAEVACALEHLHKLGVIYRDVKIENILLSRTGHVVLVDFGLATIAETSGARNCGTDLYMAPEVAPTLWGSVRDQCCRENFSHGIVSRRAHRFSIEGVWHTVPTARGAADSNLDIQSPPPSPSRPPKVFEPRFPQKPKFGSTALLLLTVSSLFCASRPSIGVRLTSACREPGGGNLPNSSFSNVRFWGKVLAPKAPNFFFGPPEWEIFFFTPCVYTQYTKNFVENSKMGEKHQKKFDP